MDGTCINCGQVGNWCTCGDTPEVQPQLVQPVFTLQHTKKSRSVEPVRFRAAVDAYDGNGEKQLTNLFGNKTSAEDMAMLCIDAGHVPRDALVTVQSSHTAADGTVTWHDQTVVQRPRSAKWRAYCEAHTFCPHCGQVVPKVEGQHADSV